MQLDTRHHVVGHYVAGHNEVGHYVAGHNAIGHSISLAGDVVLVYIFL